MKAFTVLLVFVAFLFATTTSFGQTPSPIDTNTTVGGWRVKEVVGDVRKVTMEKVAGYKGKGQCFGITIGDRVEDGNFSVLFLKKFSKPILKLHSSFRVGGIIWTKVRKLGDSLSGGFVLRMYFGDKNGVLKKGNFRIVIGAGAYVGYAPDSFPVDNAPDTMMSLGIEITFGFLYPSQYKNAVGELAVDEIWMSTSLDPDLIIEDFEDTTVTDVKDDPEIPTDFVLHQNYPNPFNPETVIRFELKKSEFVKLKVFNTLGQEVATLINQEKSPGTYETRFDASQLPSGTYFYRLTTDSFSETKKMLLLK